MAWQASGMKNELTAGEASGLVGKSAKHFRATLRQEKASGNLDPEGAWQNPPKPNGIWTIRRGYLIAFAAEQGWTVGES